MKVAMIKCDNPKCEETGLPEWEGEGRKKGQYSPPYGWWIAEGYCQGPGFPWKIEVHAVECFQPAIEAAIENAIQAERDL